MRILKFGGKSLSDSIKTQNICKFIKNIYKNDKNLIIIVSAVSSTTDDLISLSKSYGGDNFQRELAVLLSTGETQSSALFAMMLCSLGVPAKSLQAFQIEISTFGAYNDSKIAYINKSKIEKCINGGYVAVVSGFQGINSDGEITTLGRGGSDTTATAIGAIFGCDVEIYSDFDGVFCGDPRYLNYKKIKSIDYDSMIGMAHGGAKVIDARSTEIAKNFGINIISKSSAQPNKSGTKILPMVESDFISISTIDNLSKITIVASEDSKIERIVKISLQILKNIKFYNFSINLKKISFFIKNDDKPKVLPNLSKKLNLLNKNT